VAKPKGTLTPVQLEILDAVWAGDPQGATVSDIWRRIRATRPVARTTILNLVDRLHRRGWLLRHKAEGAYRFSAAEGSAQTRARLAGQFVEAFFEGSASNLVMSLLGSNRLSAADIDAWQNLDKPQPDGSAEEGSPP
jgi:BlaI family transcriptional regulator, penicillinase repressor